MTWLETIRLLPVPSVIEPARPAFSSHTPRRAPEGSGVLCPLLLMPFFCCCCFLVHGAWRRVSRPSASSVIPVAFRVGRSMPGLVKRSREETPRIVCLSRACVYSAACVPGSRPLLLIDSGPLSFPLPGINDTVRNGGPIEKTRCRSIFTAFPRWP